jgi:hypothetical protein
MCEPCVPHLADNQQPVIDDLIVDRDLAQLGRAGEELGHQQILPARRERHEAIRLRARQSGVAGQAQRVVLLLHQAADALEGLLVFEPAMQQLPPKLVPAVGAHV